jgi:hypothetical protein
VQLLNLATLHEFSTAATSLVNSDGNLLSLPKLSRDEGPNTYALDFQIGVVDARNLIDYALEAGTGVNERIRRSLRFANFVIENTLEQSTNPIRFVNKSEYTELPRLRQ